MQFLSSLKSILCRKKIFTSFEIINAINQRKSKLGGITLLGVNICSSSLVSVKTGCGVLGRY